VKDQSFWDASSVDAASAPQVHTTCWDRSNCVVMGLFGFIRRKTQTLFRLRYFFQLS